MGISGVDQASSLDMLVLQDEIISYVESLCRSLEISDETLGLEVIETAEERKKYRAGGNLYL